MWVLFVLFCLFVCDRVLWTYDPYISTSDKPSYAPSYFAYTCPSPPLLHTWLPDHHKVEWFPHHVLSARTVAEGSQVPGIMRLIQPSILSNVPVTLYDGHLLSNTLHRYGHWDIGTKYHSLDVKLQRPCLDPTEPCNSSDDPVTGAQALVLQTL